MKITKTGNVGGKNPVEVRPLKPMHIPNFDELVVLLNRYEAYKEYVDTMALASAPFVSRAAHSSAAEAIGIKRYMDKLYKRWIGS